MYCRGEGVAVQHPVERGLSVPQHHQAGPGSSQPSSHGNKLLHTTIITDGLKMVSHFELRTNMGNDPNSSQFNRES